MAWSVRKFLPPLRGIAVAVREEIHCRMHLVATLLVVAFAWWLHVSWEEAAILTLCVVVVWSAELLNTSIERLARVVTQQPNEQIRDALDLAAGSVLIAAVGAALLGTSILGSRLWLALGPVVWK